MDRRCNCTHPQWNGSMIMQVGNLYIWNGFPNYQHLCYTTYNGKRSNIWKSSKIGKGLNAKEVFCILEAFTKGKNRDYKILTLQGEVCWIRVDISFLEDDWFQIPSQQ